MAWVLRSSKSTRNMPTNSLSSASRWRCRWLRQRFFEQSGDWKVVPFPLAITRICGDPKVGGRIDCAKSLLPDGCPLAPIILRDARAIFCYPDPHQARHAFEHFDTPSGLIGGAGSGKGQMCWAMLLRFPGVQKLKLSGSDGH